MPITFEHTYFNECYENTMHSTDSIFRGMYTLPLINCIHTHFWLDLYFLLQKCSNIEVKLKSFTKCWVQKYFPLKNCAQKWKKWVAVGYLSGAFGTVVTAAKCTFTVKQKFFHCFVFVWMCVCQIDFSYALLHFCWVMH